MAHSRPKHAEIDKYTKNKLCTKLDLHTKKYTFKNLKIKELYI